MEYYKVIVPTVLSMLISVFLVTNFAFAQPLENSTFAAKPTNGLAAAESFYALHIKLIDPARPFLRVDNLTVDFPSGFDATDARVVQALNNPVLTKIPKGTLIFNYRQPTNIDSTFLIDGIVNPHNAGIYEVTVTADLGGDQVYGPIKSKVEILPYNKTIPDNSIGSEKLMVDSITGRELAGVSKILYFECGIKTANRIVSSNVKNYDPGGLKPGLPEVLAKCITPGVEEGDIVLTPLTGGPTRGGGELIPYYLNANNGSIDIHWRNLGKFDLPAGEPVRFSAFVIKVD